LSIASDKTTGTANKKLRQIFTIVNPNCNPILAKGFSLNAEASIINWLFRYDGLTGSSFFFTTIINYREEDFHGNEPGQTRWESIAEKLR
jgi:hypothetical protein